MNRRGNIIRLALGASFLAGVWAIANAGPLNPNPGPASPTPETLQTINAKLDQVIDTLGTPTSTDPELGLSAFVSMIDGETSSGRILLKDFSYEILTPFRSDQGGGGASSRPMLGEVRLVFEGVDTAFIPLLFAGLNLTSIELVQIDLCNSGTFIGDVDGCVMSIELFDVRILRNDVLGEGLEQEYFLVANRVRTTYRRFTGGGAPDGTFVHGWDFENNQAF